MKTAIIVMAIYLCALLPSYGNERCRQLESLNQQYSGASLTSSQMALKRKLVAWYMRNCTTKQARR